VGQFNWVPAVIETDSVAKNAADTVATERHTALHEIIHVLGLGDVKNSESLSRAVPPRCARDGCPQRS
jgi:hypothetical protein